MLQINFPQHNFRIKEENNKHLIFDEVRRLWVTLTPEEWVRQHFVQYLINQKGYPRSLIKLEGGLKLHGNAKRTDIVVFNPKGEKILLIECKAPSVKIDQKVFDQVARYNMVHKVALLAVSNGLQHFYCRIDFENRDYRFIEELPDYPDAGI